MFWSLKSLELQKMFPLTVFVFAEISYRQESHLRQIYLETLDSNVTRACAFFQVVHGKVTESKVDLFYWGQKRSDGGTWWAVFRPHSNIWTPGPCYGQSNGDGPPFPTVNSQVLGGHRVTERGPKWDNCYLKIGLNHRLQIFLSDGDSDLWAK